MCSSLCISFIFLPLLPSSSSSLLESSLSPFFGPVHPTRPNFAPGALLGAGTQTGRPTRSLCCVSLLGLSVPLFFASFSAIPPSHSSKTLVTIVHFPRPCPGSRFSLLNGKGRVRIVQPPLALAADGATLEPGTADTCGQTQDPQGPFPAAPSPGLLTSRFCLTKQEQFREALALRAAGKG